MKLFYAPGACSLSPHIALREAGLPFDIVKVDLRAKATESGDDFKAINPKGYVPALELEDGTIVTEGPVIVQMIADLVPKSGLAPAFGTRERYQLMDWLAFISTELHKGFSPLWHPTSGGRDAAIENLSKRFDILDRQLGDQPYLTGETFTIADAYAYAILNWTKVHKIDMGRWPRLIAFLDRVAARPAVQQALAEEGLTQARN